MCIIKMLINQLVVKLGFAHSNCNFPKTLIRCEFPTDGLAYDTIYIIGEKNHLYSIGFKCPCNNEHVVHLSLHKDEHPFWSVEFHLNGTVTLHPSIWYKQGCYSHFYIRRGSVAHV